MPTKKSRIYVSLDDETVNKIDDVMKEHGILDRASFARDAIEYYLVALTTDENTKAVVTKDTTKEIKRTITPLSSQLEEINRTTQIMLNAIWKKMNQDKKISDDALEKIVSDAINEVEAGDGLKVSGIVKSAKNAKQIFSVDDISKENFSQPSKPNVIQETNNTQEKMQEFLQPVQKQEQLVTEQPSYGDSLFEDYSQNESKNNSENSQKGNNIFAGWWGNDLHSE